MTFVGTRVGAAAIAVGEGAYDDAGNDMTEQNVDSTMKPLINTLPMVVKTQNGDGFGVIDNGNFFIPSVKMKRKKLFRRINGVTINEIVPHQPKSIVLPVKFQK